jgi:CHAT domain-containing protein
MAAFWCRRQILAPLLALLFLGACAAAPTPEDAVRTARTAIDRGDLAGAEAIIDEALKAHATRDVEAVWTLRVMRGEVLTTRRIDARKELAFALPPKYAQSETAVLQLVQRAYAHYAEPEVAMPFLEKGKAIATKHQPQALADVYRALSVFDANNRESYARQSIALAQKHGRRVVEMKAWTSIAYERVKQERYRESIEINERVLALAQQVGAQTIVQNTQGNLGWAYTELGDYEIALELFTEAEATARRIGLKREQVPWLIQLGAMSFQKREWQAASRYNREALAVDPQHDQAGSAYANLARAAIELGQFDEARRLNAQALKTKRDADEELQSEIIEARIVALRDRDFARAEKLLLGVIDKAKHEQSTRWEAEARLADIFARSNRLDEAGKYYARAVDTARDAREEITDRELRFSFFNSVAEMFDAYVDFLVRNGQIEEALGVMELSRAESLEDERRVTTKLDARAIAKKNNAIILSYWLGRDRSYLFVITPDRIAHHQLPPDKLIERAVQKYANGVRSPRGTMELAGKAGAELYETLLAPAKVPKGARVMIVSDGALNTLNFETLVAPAPQHYWIEDAVVMNAGSLQLLERGITKPSAAPSMLLIGNAPTVDPAFPALSHAASEMSVVARRFERRTVLEAAKATPAAYHAASPDKFDYVHFVAHGVAARKRPLDSAVILARDADNSYKLLARDVGQNPLMAKLVTISSCDSAGTRTYAGEGVVGLAWAFQKAGADQVIAALWKVNDATTPALMDEMYKGIRAGKDPAVALRDAKLTLVRSKGVHRHPRFWAPFVLYAGT